MIQTYLFRRQHRFGTEYPSCNPKYVPRRMSSSVARVYVFQTKNTCRQQEVYSQKIDTRTKESW